MRITARRIAPHLAIAALLAGCSSSPTGPNPSGPTAQSAYVITTDFTTGGLSAIDLVTRQATNNVASVHSDATLRVFNGLIYVVNRFAADNIQVIDPARGYATVAQFSTGNGSNPQDIAFVSSSKAYVSRYGSADLLIVNPSSGRPGGTISLAGFADSDGLPEMAHMAIVGPYLFVACQRLTNFAAVNPSVVAVIDTRKDNLVDLSPVTPGIQGITLAARDPFTDFAYDAPNGDLLIGCVGTFGVADGGIERIDVASFRSLGLTITEAAIGGDVLDIAWNGPTHSYAIVSDASFNNQLVGWDPTAGTVVDTLFAPGAPSLPDCAINELGELYLADNRFTAPGVRIYRVDADTLIVGPISTGLPPNQIAFR